MIAKIRLATPENIDRLMEIFDHARSFMRKAGNENQWINGYPQRDFMLREIKDKHCFVCEDQTKKIIATFCFIKGPDPTYSYIEKGKWLSDDPYYVIHRMASDGSCKGIAATCYQWCRQYSTNLRVDTHPDNFIMRHSLESNGFKRCGIIYVANGTQRIAYQRE